MWKKHSYLTVTCAGILAGCTSYHYSRAPDAGSDGGSPFKAGADVRVDGGSADVGADGESADARADGGSVDARVEVPDGGPATTIPPLIANLPPGQWAEVQNSEMRQVLYNGPLASQIRGNSGPDSVVTKWSGGTLDTKRDKLIIWGGGHRDYAGNEVYAFDLHTLQWERLSDPSSITGYDGSSGEYPDGMPASTHTYDALTYLPDPYDGLFVSALPSIYSTGAGSLVTWLFSFQTNTWKKLTNAVAAAYGNSMTAYDPTTGHVWEQGGIYNSQAYMIDYDPVANTWTKHGGYFSLPYYIQTGAIDPDDHLFVAVGGRSSLISEGQSTQKALAVWDLKNSPGNQQMPTRTGPSDVEDAASPGFVWYPPGKEFVGWPNGGSAVYSLDPKTWTWAMHPAAAGNTVVPQSGAAGGTFGRFQYVPDMAVFVLVTSSTDNVYIYKRPPGS